ncbi:cytochrome b558/566 subunit A [Sulfuracidifex metallicus]|uniref:Cytochrome b558/566 subunit A n=1 Tax=Sulfuracidifex metallicus DSM 6482 = JCM 9184 TaxID=523847 RepID=A0A6A9QJ12_SULME|nr:cytochrome b558/566 subunit A [Sulfuracidifex metallicus]MUN28966.1 cytochrome b558/566 subunit A [Sulfuracidifex metallicus DSM 6482 = JCM 9184]WOE51995.1 cytochrome b558/566 subunit A [Sulfuracidifex metallicus DSM 6482 = JCM 9184]
MELRKVRTVFSLILIASILSLLMAFMNVPMAQTTSQITVYKEVGSANLKAPGTESFWNNIPWTNLSLSANIPNAPTSGLTHNLSVKAAWNGTDIFILLRWNAPNPAFGAWSAAVAGIDPNASGPGLFRIIEITPGAKYQVMSNYTSYYTIVNGTKETGRLFLSYDGISEAMPNGSQIKVLGNGTILFYHSLRPIERILYDSGLFYGYYTNSTWYYPDRAAMMWYMGSGTPTMDGMHIGGKFPGQTFDGENFTYAGGALKQPGGAANIWMWVSGATWNNKSEDPAFKYNVWENKSMTGLPYTNNGTGFAVPLYTNNTNMYEVDCSGIWYAPVKSSGLEGSLFFIESGATYSNGYWTLELVRPLAVPTNYSQYMPNITIGKTYDVAFAVWQGAEGETLFDKSITSSFLLLSLSSLPKPESPVLAVNPEIVDITTAGVVIAVIALAAIWISFRR